jgi:hypothetical protein
MACVASWNSEWRLGRARCKPNRSASSHPSLNNLGRSAGRRSDRAPLAAGPRRRPRKCSSLVGWR